MKLQAEEEIYAKAGTTLKYVSLSCEAEVEAARCSSYGSNKKRQLF
jgi:hypothetical protein